jgi:hypothetical protein
MRDLYVILSVTGWAWCLAVAALLWVRLRSRRGATDGPAATGASGDRPEAEA